MVSAPIVIADCVKSSVTMAAMDDSITFNPEYLAGRIINHVSAAASDVDLSEFPTRNNLGRVVCFVDAQRHPFGFESSELLRFNERSQLKEWQVECFLRPLASFSCFKCFAHIQFSVLTPQRSQRVERLQRIICNKMTIIAKPACP